MSARQSTGQQDQLETRARQLQGVNLEGCTDFGRVFGSAAEWVMELGPFRFFLIPFLGEWWFYDEPHGEWRFTGKRLGQVHFAFDGTRLCLEEPAPSPTPSVAPSAGPSRAHNFCVDCGARVKSTAKFCQSCGAELAE